MSIFGRNLLARPITPLTFAIDAVVASLLAPKPVVVAKPAPVVPASTFADDTQTYNEMVAKPGDFTKADVQALAGRIGCHVAGRWTKAKMIEAIGNHRQAQTKAA